jgi:hypothetical protein
MATRHYRQGDLLIVEVSEIPAEATMAATNILAEDEVTGHAHRIVGGDVLTVDVEKYFAVQEAARIMHEEHHTITLPPGLYRVRRQREYAPQVIRRVARQGIRRVLD